MRTNDFHVIIGEDGNDIEQPSVEICPGLDGEVSQEFTSTDEAYDALQAEIFHLERWARQEAEEIQARQRDLQRTREALVGLRQARDKVGDHL